MVDSEKDSLSSAESSPRTVRCPQCRGPSVYGETNPYRPFCSERCKLIDLGTWASDGYAIPGEPVPQPEDDPQDGPGS